MKTINRKSLLCTLIAFYITPLHSNAQQIIDIDSTMKNNIVEQGRLNVFNKAYCDGKKGLSGIVSCWVNAENNLQKSKINQISSILAAPPTVSSIYPSAIPESIEKEIYLIKNCTPSSRLLNEEISVTIQSSYNISTSQTFIRNTSSDTGLDIKLDLGKASIGGSGKKTASFSTSSSQSSTNSGSETSIKKETVNETIPPHTALLISTEKTLRNAVQDFSAQVFLDGKFSNHKGAAVIQYSSILTTNPPILLSGSIYGSDFKTMKKTYTEVSLPTSPVECNNFDIEKFLGESSSLSNKPTAAANNIQKRSLAFSNGFTDSSLLTIKPKGLGIIQIRSKASGIECGIEVASPGTNPIKFITYNNSWSEWKTLRHYTNAENIYISATNSCQNGEIEIRF